ncbi:MAG: VWA domain-containing protein [Myxococcales bacterium]|nr:VWA domain-containing protein [Myxococcales bacterium]
MFVELLYHLRANGLAVATPEWITLMAALARGHARSSLSVFYHLARSIVVKSEAEFDRYDVAFSSFFEGVDAQFSLDEELLRWLEDPKLPRALTAEELAQLQALDLDTLRKQFEERLREQKERHDGGNRWVGTGGTSPFGNGGTNPAGIRVGGTGGGRTAVQVANDRRYKNLRSDRVLDTRQIGVALRKLRRLARTGLETELDVDRTIDKTARGGGEIDLVFCPPRASRLKLLLLMDVGGSMDPHVEISERLFSAAHAATHFKAFESYFFHNCPYDRLYKDFAQLQGVATEDVLKKVDETWTLVFVGDAYMHPFELTQVGGAIYYGEQNATTGLDWLRRFRTRVPRSVWLNPETPRVWNAPSVRTIRGLFPMFQLSLAGLDDAVAVLRGARPNRPSDAELFF